MKTSTARDRHCCAVSQQTGEISPRQEKVNQTTHTANLKKKEFGVYWFIYQHHHPLQGRAGGEKPSVTFLNNSLSIFVIRCRRNDFTSNV